MPGKIRRTMATLEGPSDDGLIPPDPDALLEQRRIEIKEAAAKAAEEEPVLTADEEDEVVDLMHAGRKERFVEVFNRNIHLRTLTIAEELKVSEITKPYLNSDGWGRAYRTAVVAAAIRTIDGKLLFNPMSDNEFDQIIVKKFEILLDYYPLAVDQIYNKYRELELELLALVDKLGKSSG
jgi:hypothetical protein